MQPAAGMFPGFPWADAAAEGGTEKPGGRTRHDTPQRVRRRFPVGRGVLTADGKNIEKGRPSANKGKATYILSRPQSEALR